MALLIPHLESRGFIDSITNQDLRSLLHEKSRMSVYCGFDPTAESLHLGNLVALMGLAWFRRAGHDVVALVGGATGMIGDPSGKNQERRLLDEKTLARNVAKIRDQISTILGRVPGSGKVEICNNHDWYRDVSCIDFLRDIGKHFRVGVMLSKDSVKGRLHSDEGLSYTEFSYQVLQSHDFYHLFTNHGVSIQLGGRDQWGNITAGIEYVRKRTQEEVYGITFPLLTKSDGQKFGKSETGALWLSSEMLSEYDFYQYFFKVHDDDALRLLKIFSFLSLEEVDALASSMSQPQYIPNTVQRRLAEEVTRFVHGEEGLSKAIQATSSLMPGHAMEYTMASIESMLLSVPAHVLDCVGKSVLEVAAASGLVSSKSEARRLIKNGGVALNGVKVSSDDAIIDQSMLVSGRYLVLSIGKKQRAVFVAPNE